MPELVLDFQPTCSTCRFFSISPFKVSVSRKATRRSWHNRNLTKNRHFRDVRVGRLISLPHKNRKKASHSLPVSSVCAVQVGVRETPISLHFCCASLSLRVKCRPTKSCLTFQRRSHQCNNKQSSRSRVPRKWLVKTKSSYGNSIHK